MGKYRITDILGAFLLTLACIPYTAEAQSPGPKKDSLRAMLSRHPDDSTKAELYLALADTYKYTAPELTFFYADTAFSIAQKNQIFSQMALSASLKGIHFKVTGQFQKSLAAYFESIRYNRLSDDTLNWASNLSNIGNLYFALEDFGKSESYFQEALELQKGRKNELNMIPIYINLGAVHIDGTKNYDEAIRYLQHALTASEKLGKTRFMIPTLINLSEVYFHKKDLGKSMETIGKAAGLARKVSDENSLAYIQYCYGKIYKEQQDYETALDYLGAGLLSAQQLKLKPIEEKIEKEMSEIYALLNDYEKAYTSHERYAQINDSLQKNQKEMIMAHKDYDDARHQSKIEESGARSSHLARQKKNYLYIGSALVILSLVIMALIYFRKEKWASKSRVIESENKQLSSSNVQLKKQLGQLAIKIAEEEKEKSPQKKQASGKYANSSLKEEEREEYMQRLLDYMDKEEPYLDPDLDLATLSKAISVNPRHMSEVLNVCLQKNFYDFINLYRVEALKKKIVDAKDAHKKILAVAYEVGFNSKTAFNNAFKKNTGMTPSQYRAAHIDAR